MTNDRHERYPTQSNNFIYTLSHEARIDAAMNVWGDSLLRVAYTYMGSIADAEDIFQEVFIKLYQTQTTFHSGKHLKAWLFTVTRTTSLDALRKRDCLTFEELNEERISEIEHSEWGSPVELLSALEIIQALPLPQRICVSLHHVEGYKTDEIAQLLHCAPQTVRTRLYRARQKTPRAH